MAYLGLRVSGMRQQKEFVDVQIFSCSMAALKTFQSIPHRHHSLCILSSSPHSILSRNGLQKIREFQISFLIGANFFIALNIRILLMLECMLPEAKFANLLFLQLAILASVP